MRYIHLVILCAVFFGAFGGILRDDVDQKKSFELAAQPQFKCVGKVLRKDTLRGSCVLISNKFILSAAHVFMEGGVIIRLDTIKIDDTTSIMVPVYTKDTVGDISHYKFQFGKEIYTGKKLTVHPVYLDSSSNGACDIAIIELDKPVQNIITPRINLSHDELHSLFVGVGYGVIGSPKDPSSIHHTDTINAGENTIDSVGGYKLDGLPTMLVSDFDSPTNKEWNKLGSPEPTPMEYIGSGGDSGGGFFRQVNGTWELIGVYSETSYDMDQFVKSSYYGQTMAATRVSAFAKWIQENTK